MSSDKTVKENFKEKSTPDDSAPGADFIRQIIDQDILDHKNNGKVLTRFPPEPNGYLHIGHAKSICLNFNIAKEYNGHCNLRFDDTNPSKENVEYVESIKANVRWLGFDWEDRLMHASDYFEKLYDYAVQLIKLGKAYVCSLTAEEMKDYRGTLTEPGKESPYRHRSIEENLAMFEKMRNGDYEDGAHVLRAKIDITSPNVNMRDPIIYRIRKMSHQQTGDTWCIYPMYDFTHCLSDSIEGITHSLCTLEFEDHRPLYDWFLDELNVECHPQQIEFSRLFLKYTVTSKRKLNDLVQENHVSGWDDPRMPTLSGLRRRGYTPESIRDFCGRLGISKSEHYTDMSLLEDCIRQDLDQCAPRAMCVLRPLKVIIDNYPEGQVEELSAPCHPKNPEMGTRTLPFSRVLYIEQEDFCEDPPPKYFRLSPGKEVRLRNAYIILCESVVKDDTGAIVEVHCTYDPETRSGMPKSGRKVKGILHWLSAEHSLEAEVRLYDRLFNKAIPDDGKDGQDFRAHLNPNSIETLTGCRVEPGLEKAQNGTRFQFERLGYFCMDAIDSKPEALVFNRTVSLRNSWDTVEKEE